MDPVVTAVAEQPAVVDGGRAAALPRDEVVHFADARRGVTARSATGPISRDHRLALSGCDDAAGARDLGGLPVPAEHDAGQLAVAGDAIEHRSRQWRLRVRQHTRVDARS